MSSFYQGKVRYNKEEWKNRNLQLLSDLELHENLKLDKFNELINDREGATLTGSLIYSSLISQTNSQKYTHKIIECGDYYQVYSYQNTLVKKEKGSERLNHISINKIDTDFLVKKSNSMKKEQKKIELKNIYRSVFQLQRLVKSNELDFKTFITLTYEENQTSIETANKHFNSWRTYIKKLKSDFKYVCVPEFQKRGAIHYHLLTNIDYTDFSLLSKEEHKHHSDKYKKWSVGRYIAGWNKGFNLVQNMDSINVVGYLTKYMTKDIDDRLWGKRRYLYSLNLKQPSVVYLDENDIDDNSKMLFIELFHEKKYNNTYYNKIGEPILFEEFKRKA